MHESKTKFQMFTEMSTLTRHIITPRQSSISAGSVIMVFLRRLSKWSSRREASRTRRISEKYSFFFLLFFFYLNHHKNSVEKLKILFRVNKDSTRLNPPKKHLILSNEKSYQCAEIHPVVKHLRIHRSVKLYSCDKCGIDFRECFP